MNYKDIYDSFNKLQFLLKEPFNFRYENNVYTKTFYSNDSYYYHYVRVCINNGKLDFYNETKTRHGTHEDEINYHLDFDENSDIEKLIVEGLSNILPNDLN